MPIEQQASCLHLNVGEWTSKLLMKQSKSSKKLLVLLWLTSSSQHHCIATKICYILETLKIFTDIDVIVWIIDVHLVRIDVTVDHSAYAKWTVV